MNFYININTNLVEQQCLYLKFIKKILVPDNLT